MQDDHPTAAPTPRIRAFADAVRPDAARQGPLQDWRQRLRKEAAASEVPQRAVLHMPQGHDFIVELRIRQWLMRMQLEARDARAHEKRRPPAP